MSSSIPARRAPSRRPRFSPPSGEAKSSWRSRLGFTTRPLQRCSIARALRDAHKRVGLVGHNPGLGELAMALTGSGAEPERHRLAAKYPTGAVAVLDFSIQRWEQVARNSGMLALYLTPAELEADAD